jgi:hypothetical protein
VFRAFPYLYEGDRAYERDYLSAYAQSPGAMVVGAFAGDLLAGAATAAPVCDRADTFAAPRRGAPLRPLHPPCYFGESALLPE